MAGHVTCGRDQPILPALLNRDTWENSGELCLVQAGHKSKALPLEPVKSIGPFWKVLTSAFGEKIPHGPEL